MATKPIPVRLDYMRQHLQDFKDYRKSNPDGQWHLESWIDPMFIIMMIEEIEYWRAIEDEKTNGGQLDETQG